MPDKSPQNNLLDESELFQLGGKKSNFLILPAQLKYKHIKIDEVDKPLAAVIYNGYTYSLFRTSSDWAEVEKLTSRLSAAYVITVISKGWAIWVFEY